MWKSIKIENSHIGFNLTSGDGDGHVGSITVVDSMFKNCDMAILVANTNATSTGRTSLSLDNVLFDGVPTWLREQSAKGTPKDNKFSSNPKAIDMLTVGRTYQDTKLEEEQKAREFSSQRVEGLLALRNPWGLPKQPYAERSKPQYEGFADDAFVHVKDSCKGEFDWVNSEGFAVLTRLQGMALPMTLHAFKKSSTITGTRKLFTLTLARIS